MLQKVEHSYLCLTLFKQDIKELIRLFQTHLQDVDIVIDNQQILNDLQFEQYITHLEQFDPHYQIRSLKAQGNYTAACGRSSEQQREPQRIDLSINQNKATLIIWKEIEEEEPIVVTDVNKLLLGHVNRIHQVMVICSFILAFLSPSSSLIISAQQHHLDFSREILLGVGVGVPIGVATFILLTVILHVLQLDKRIFLFPLVTKPVRKHGWYETIGTVVAALILIMLISNIIIYLLHILWR